MNVLMYGWEFPPHNSGGLGTACQGLTQALVRQGVGVHFVLPRKSPVTTSGVDFIFADNDARISVISSPLSPYMTPAQYKRALAMGLVHSFSANLMDEVMRYARVAGEVAGRVSHEVIHAHDWMTYGAGIEARKISIAPLIMHVHSTEKDRSGGHVNPQVFELEHDSLRQADKIVAVSEYTRRILQTDYGIKPSRVEVVHNGVVQPSDALFHKASRRRPAILKKHGHPIILYVGRFTLHKGLDYLIRAMKKVVVHHPHARLVLVGSGEKEHELIELVAELDLSAHVIFAGWMRGEQLARMYASADVYVQPSVSEPFGISPLEALSHKTPVIVSKQSGIAEGIHHALKVDFWDVDGLAEKISGVLSYPSVWSQLQINGHKESRQFTWKKSAQACRHIYSSLL